MRARARGASLLIFNAIIYDKYVENQTTSEKSSLFSRLTKILWELQKMAPRRSSRAASNAVGPFCEKNNRRRAPSLFTIKVRPGPPWVRLTALI